MGWKEDSHLSCDVVQPFPHCGPSFPQLLFDQHRPQKFKHHVGPIQQGQFLMEEWEKHDQNHYQDRSLLAPQISSLSPPSRYYSLLVAPLVSASLTWIYSSLADGKVCLETSHVPPDHHSPGEKVELRKQARVGRRDREWGEYREGEAAAGWGQVWDRIHYLGIDLGSEGTAARSSLPRSLYPSEAVDISPLLPAASSGLAQPWRGRKPAGSGRGPLGLTLWKVPGLRKVPFLACGGDSPREAAPRGTHCSLSWSGISTHRRPQRVAGETEPLTPQPNRSRTHVLASILVNPEVNRECWGKTAPEPVSRRTPGNVVLTLSMSGVLLKRQDSEGFKVRWRNRDGKRICTVAWVLASDCPFFITWA